VSGPVVAAVAFGSNVGDRELHVGRALARLAATPGVAEVARSRVVETKPVGGPPQGDFLNGVVLVETTLAADELLRVLLAIEREEGRIRAGRDGPRTIDLDLVAFGDAVIERDGLTVPHPRAHERGFVLEPLAEVAPDWVHPRLRRTARELRDEWRLAHPGEPRALAAARAAGRRAP
jgi:2-amino-4-hydroxy-6-hydroxymethyldihydropteridine diphosphokinase